VPSPPAESGSEETVPIESVEVRDVIVVRPGGLFAADGEVLSNVHSTVRS
jgi:cation transport ATPase